MSETYFSKFPTINYGNVVTIDISKSVGLSEKTKRIPTHFYPYELKNETRADTVANAYYQDPYLDWLIFIVNDVIDPYYDWYMGPEKFTDFIKEKYKSSNNAFDGIEQAQKRIKYYRTNWYNDQNNITASFYQNNLTKNLKKYYVPEFGQGKNIISYTRRTEDWFMNTNKLVQLSVASSNGFVKGEIVDIVNNDIRVAGGEVIAVDDNSITIKNVDSIENGLIANNKVVAESSNANAVITDVETLVTNIPDDEIVFWEPVYLYEFESEKNEDRKFIKLLDQQYTMEVSEEMRLKLLE